MSTRSKRTSDSGAQEAAGEELRAAFERIPALVELMAIPQWVAFDKAKVPHDPNAGGHARSNDPHTWGPFHRAVRAVVNHRDDVIGVGFELGDGTLMLVLIDFDHCIDEHGVVDPDVLKMVHQLDSYTEVSPSGRGLHVLVHGTLPGENLGHIEPPDGVEIYARDRFGTITGKHLEGTPDTIESRQDEIDELYAQVAQRRGIKVGGKGNTSSDNAAVQMVLDALKKKGHRVEAKPGGEYETTCPAHSDHNPSLGVRAGDNGGVLTHCFTGCTYEQVLEALGLTPLQVAPGVAGNGNGHKPQQVQLNLNDQTDELVDQTVAALGEAHDPTQHKPSMFVRGGRLTQVQVDEENRPSLVMLDAPGLLVEVDRVVDFGWWKKNDAGEWVFTPDHPPNDVIQGVLRHGNHRVPPLRGVTEVPVLRGDGSVLRKYGYDPATRLVYRPVPDAKVVAHVSGQPTDEEVASALELVWEAIGDFPYEAPADRANALAALLSPVMRAAIDGPVPLLLVDKPRAGTGASLFCETLVTITIGHGQGKMTEAESDAEWRKKITTALLAGHPVNVIDNVTHRLSSGHLSSALTEPVWTDRLLGKHQDVRVASRAIWIATGNNIRIGGDLPRRTYRVRMDAKEPQPWTRDPSDFQHTPLLPWVRENRARLVHALLTIARASFVRDVAVGKLPTLGGFEEWVRVVGRAAALDARFGPHFLGNVEEVWVAEDTETGEWEAFLVAWEESYGEEAVTTKQIHNDVRPDTYGQPMNQRLYDALPGDLAEALAKKVAFPTLLGSALRDHRETRYGRGDEQLRLVNAGKDPHTQAALWRVEVGAPSEEGGIDLSGVEAREEPAEPVE